MGLSLTSRPSTWSAVKNPVVYKFATTGGPFTNYRVEIEVFKASDDTSLTDGVKIQVSPGADNVTYADISEVVKAYLAADWTKPATINEVEAGTDLEVYIKYQELYEGSAVAVVDDVANPFHCVLAGLQVPSAVGNNLTNYVPASSSKKFLTVLDRPKIWRGYPLTLSFIFPAGLELWLLKRQYNAAGVLQVSSNLELTAANDNAVNRSDLPNDFFGLDDDAKTMLVKLQQNVEHFEDTGFPDGIDGIDWFNLLWNSPEASWVSSVGSGVEVPLTGATEYSRWLTQNLGVVKPAGDYTLAITGFVTPVGYPIIGLEVWVALYNGAVLVEEFPTGLSFTDFSTSPSFDFTAIGAFNSFRIGVKRMSTLNDGTVFFEEAHLTSKEDMTEEITCDIVDPVDNPIMLVWKNSLGGDAQQLFDINQEYTYRMEAGKKVKRVTLIASHLTLNEWEAINELNNMAEIYRNTIQELTSSVRKTHSQIGQQVYIIDESGNKTGVVVIAKAPRTDTRRVRHFIEIDIDMPEVI